MKPTVPQYVVDYVNENKDKCIRFYLWFSVDELEKR